VLPSGHGGCHAQEHAAPTRRDERHAPLTEADQRELIAELRVQELAGHITESERRELTGAIWASNTPHEVYRRTHGLLGDPHPQGGWNVRRIAMFYLVIPVAMIVVTIFAALAVKMGLV
jgi:hypothetical protein